MKKKLIVLGTTLILILGIAGGAFAAGWGGGPWAAGDGQWTPPIMSVNPTDEQLGKLQELRNDFFNKTQSLRMELQTKMFELRGLYLQKNPDQNQIDAKKAEVEQLRSQLYDLRQSERQELSKIFTQEQLDQMATQRGFGGHGMRGGRGHGGFPGFKGAWGATQTQ